MTATQRYWILGITLLVTVILVLNDRGTDNTDGDIVQVSTTRTRQDQSGLTQQGEVTQTRQDVRVALLHRPRLPETAQDLFVTQSWLPPAEVKQALIEPAAPALPYIYIGKMRVNDTGFVVFLDKQGVTYSVKEGDIIEKTYLVETVRPPLMTLMYLPMKIKQTIKIGDAS